MATPPSFSDLPEPARKAIFAAAWQAGLGKPETPEDKLARILGATPSPSATLLRNSMRLVCHEAQAAVDDEVRAVTFAAGTGADAEALASAVAAGRFVRLQEATINDGSSGAASLIKALAARPLRVLRIGPGALDHSGTQAAVALAEWRHLEELRLSGNRMGLSTLAKLTARSALPALRKLTCSWCKLVDGAVELAGDWPPYLEELDFCGTPLTPEWVAELGTACAQMPKLHILHLGGTCLDDTRVKELAQAGIWPALDLLDLSRNRFGVDGVAALAAAGGGAFPALRSLNLSDQQIGHAVHLVMQGSWPCLEDLQLANTGTTAQGAAAIAAAVVRFPKLAYIDLSRNALRDDGVKAIAAATWPSLRVLDLDDNSLSDEGAKTLAAARTAGRLPGLRILLLGMNNKICPGMMPLLEEAFGDDATVSFLHCW